jgi:hypothetical protein
MEYKITKQDSIKAQVITDLFKSVHSKGERIHHILGDKYIQSLINMLEQKPIYRLEIHDRTGEVITDCYDLLENFAPELKRSYNNINDMPKWAQEKIAVLMVLDPSKINEEVEGVGRRITRNVYWLYKENENGNDSRGES